MHQGFSASQTSRVSASVAADADAHNTHDDGLLHTWGTSSWIFLGDWITPHGSESNITSGENILFNNAYLHYITKLVAQISAILGHDDKATQYHAAATKLAAAVRCDSSAWTSAFMA